MVTGQMVQRLSAPSPANYIGKGKLEELKALKSTIGYDLVIVDDELSAVQQKNLEDSLETKIIDRTALILDVFARRAQTKEGKLQVELAQHQYLLPRLTGRWAHLERLGAGIGTRGPGESQLETDRRLIKQRIHLLQNKIEDVRRHRALYRSNREKHGLKIVACVGYTNAGKSTLFNSLSAAGVLAEDKPFSTLDPTTRVVKLNTDTNILLTDTVGFIQKLPTSIIAAFRATLEELSEATLLLHVIDITHENAPEQTATVDSILKRLQLFQKPKILVLNKIDRLLKREGDIEEVKHDIFFKHGFNEKDVVFVSASNRWGLPTLIKMIGDKIKCDQYYVKHNA